MCDNMRVLQSMTRVIWSIYLLALLSTSIALLSLPTSSNMYLSYLNLKSIVRPKYFTSSTSVDNFNLDLVHAPFQIGAIFTDLDDKFWFFQTLMRQIMEHQAPLKSKRVRQLNQHS